MKIFNMGTKGTTTAWFVGILSAFVSQITTLTLSEWSAVVAIFSTLVGLCLTWYYKRKADRRDELETKAKLKHYESHKKNHDSFDL